ncbi:Hypothetical protein DPCES_0742 [Desulfitobacterium hafniense]|uniref:Uncharacterized protein n=1 Tax=Desulfitobacterium hafniense TaxID=49338 RepID=A0A098AVM6_DESHA|nr:hypothetical protein [Desulfitobacterium hafniense]CDX00629.1 Hypothetical protein DPCES_0742 [Desulfitobacterium hafniense]
MNKEDLLKEEVKKIKDLIAQGYTARHIIDLNDFSYEALKCCGLPASYLIPKTDPQKMNLQEWDTHTSAEHKWEYADGVPFIDADQRDRVMLGLIYSSGLKHLLEILPEESKKILKELVNSPPLTPR